MKKFFDIKEDYRFEIWDLTALVTIFNVAFVLMGFWWAPILGLVNCTICLIAKIKKSIVSKIVTMLFTFINFIIFSLTIITSPYFNKSVIIAPRTVPITTLKIEFLICFFISLYSSAGYEPE